MAGEDESGRGGRGRAWKSSAVSWADSSSLGGYMSGGEGDQSGGWAVRLGGDGGDRGLGREASQIGSELK